MGRHTVARIFLVLSSLLWVLVGQSVAQTPINFNQTILGEITTTPLNYSFTGNANQLITLEINSVSDGFAPSFLLLDASNNIIAQGQPPTGAFDIRQDVTLPATGNYTLIITTTTAQIGEFTLRLSSADAPAQPPSTGGAAQCETITTDLMFFALEEVCRSVGRNQICYVNPNLETLPILPNFATVGDISNLADLASITMSSYANDGANWGVALMQIQANLPDTLPGQNVTILAFGGVSLQANPQANATAPMQSFYFTGGIGESECRETPTDGIYIESPSDASVVELIVNDVSLQVASSIFIGIDNSQATSKLEFNTLEGVVVIESGGVTQVAPAGQRVAVQINEQGQPIAPPEAPQPVDDTRIPAPVREIVREKLEPTPSAPIATVPALPSATPFVLPSPTPTEGIIQPDLPSTGACVLATLNPVVVNARSGPNTDFDVTGQIQPIDVLPVVARSRDNSWYQTELGWSASFVTRLGGDCSNLPIGDLPPPTAVPQQFPIVGEPLFLEVDVLSLGVQRVFGGQLSYPQGFQSITVNTRVLNRQQNERQVNLQIRCNGSGAAYTSLVMDSGQIFECTDKFLGVSTDVDSFRYSFVMSENVPQGATVDWQITMEVLR